jgi:hypothetical protein
MLGNPLTYPEGAGCLVMIEDIEARQTGMKIITALPMV